MFGSEAKISPNLSKFVLLIIAVYPLTLFNIEIMSGLSMLLLFIAGLYFMAVNWSKFEFTLTDQYVFTTLLLFFIIALITSYLADFSIAQRTLNRLMLIPFALPIYLLVRNIKNIEPIFWYMTALGAAVACGVAFYDVIILKQGRAHGVTHPILFGNIALSLGVISLTGYHWFKAKGGVQFLIPLFAFFAGLTASILSLSRGSWIALPVIFLILMFYFKASLKTLIISIVLFCTALFIIYSIPQTGVKDRLNQTLSNINNYAESPIQSHLRATSIGTRFEMWQASIEIIKHNPLVGVGWGQYKTYAQRQVDAKLRNRSAVAFGHPHNEYFAVLVASGAIGFIGLIALFLIPLRVFFKGIKEFKGKDTSIYYAGIAHVLLYMHYALSEAVLERSRSVTFFVMYLVIILALVHAKNDRIVMAENVNKPL